MPEGGGHRRRRPLLRPALILAVLFLAGAVVRLLGGDALISTTLVYSKSAPEGIPGTGTPEDTVRSFYLMLDRGMYAEAWDLVVEPDWTGLALVPYTQAVVPGVPPVAATPREHFVQRLNAELGYGGIWLKLRGVDARKLDKPGPPPALLPVAGLEAQSATRVRAQGTLLGACTIFSWHKELDVLRVDGRYRLVLEGSKRASGFFYQEWFTNLETIGSLRAVAP